MKDTEKPLILLITIVVMNFIFFPLVPLIFIGGMIYISWDTYKKEELLMNEKREMRDQLLDLSKQVRKLSSELDIEWDSDHAGGGAETSFRRRRVPTRHQLANNQ